MSLLLSSLLITIDELPVTELLFLVMRQLAICGKKRKSLWVDTHMSLLILFVLCDKEMTIKEMTIKERTIKERKGWEWGEKQVYCLLFTLTALLALFFGQKCRLQVYVNVSFCVYLYQYIIHSGHVIRRCEREKFKHSSSRVKYKSEDFSFSFQLNYISLSLLIVNSFIPSHSFAFSLSETRTHNVQSSMTSII